MSKLKNQSAQSVAISDILSEMKDKTKQSFTKKSLQNLLAVSPQIFLISQSF